ncbi:MAG: hypothetical protein WCT52_00570 [Candidatus Micrarchaeia archaeon]
MLKQIELGFGIFETKEDRAKYHSLVGELVLAMGRQQRYGDLCNIVRALAKNDFKHFEARRVANRIGTTIIERLDNVYDEWQLSRDLKRECGEALEANPVKAFTKKALALYAKDDFYNARNLMSTLSKRLIGSSDKTKDFEGICSEFAAFAGKQGQEGKRILTQAFDALHTGASDEERQVLKQMWETAYPGNQYPYSANNQQSQPRNHFREVITGRDYG